ncbi:MAG: 2-dehydro-3-deoxygalactonokinase [Ginsengibacter sp.]
MNKFISCDWGTSSFRLQVIELETQDVMAKVVSQQGIAATYEMWKKSSSDRFLFYESVLSSCIRELSSQCGYPLSEIPIIISGMASSAIGMMALDYKMLPVKTNGNDLLIHIVASSARFKHQMIFVSGLKSTTDVMRGEETIITGCEIKNTDEEQLFILPGTHSKHIITRNGMITDSKTYMTGELFDLLATKSILSNSVEKENIFSTVANPRFEKGVKEGLSSNLLNSIFHVRTNSLFNKQQPKENYHYLSGLLIGTELKDLPDTTCGNITLVTDEKFSTLYSNALHLLKINKNIYHINSDKALIKGQSIIYKLYSKNITT